MHNQKEKGFTLLELIMVIVTISVLVLVLIPNILVSRKRAYDTKAKACLKELSTAQNVYFISEFTYATDATKIPSFPERTCNKVVLSPINVTVNEFQYSAKHQQSDHVFYITTNKGVSDAP